jgi:hypothetical protein
MRVASLSLAAFILSVPAAASAQSVTEDARCLLVSSTYARTAKDPRARQVAQTASAFYLGRVDGRYSPAALKAALATGLKLVSAGNAAGIMNTCAARLAQAETQIQAMAPALPRVGLSKPAGSVTAGPARR